MASPYLSGFSNRLTFTVDSSLVGSDLTDFPVRVSLTDAQIFTDLSNNDSNRLKIAVTADDGTTQRYVEIETYDFSNDVLVIHTKLPVSSTVDTDHFFYWDATAADNTTYVGDIGSTAGKAVWDSGFKMVFHMTDPTVPGYISLCSVDSNNNLTHSGTVPVAGDFIDTPNGKGVEFDGTNQRASKSGVGYTGLNDTAQTLEAYFNFNNLTIVTPGVSGNDSIFNNYTTGGLFSSLMDTRGGELRGYFRISGAGTAVPGLVQITTGAWHYGAVAWSSGNSIKVYLDDETVTQSVVRSGSLTIGNTLWTIADTIYQTNREADAKIDEVRLSDVERSADWINATRSNLSGALVTVGSVEAPVVGVPGPSDQYYGPDPTVRLTAASDMFLNSHTNAGDAWYDVLSENEQDTAWDILNAFAQDTAWDILNENKPDIAWDIITVFLQNTTWGILNDNEQDISWSIFADQLFFLQQLFAKQICFNYGTAQGEYLGVPIGQECSISEPQEFNVQLTNKIKFTFIPSVYFGAGLVNFEKRN